MTGSAQTLANQVILLMILSFMTFQTSESKLRGRSHIASAAGGGRGGKPKADNG